ncbi:hypothetical protein KDX30_23440 [Pseudomonas sp. CDFA 553]|uniref:hypothetical protein n=1 Tax=Pseudomonas quasicaspiana TaxID=2829821 RepID=UPI001E4E5052|nr:hypothetical protein [Pseudomonas quasicaspiana]MCD5990833.1 hypothetical protein [Pseudomonas quasicaspiana]
MNINNPGYIERRTVSDRLNESIKPTNRFSQQNKNSLEEPPFAITLKEKTGSVETPVYARSVSTKTECNRLMNEISSNPEVADMRVRDYAHESLGVVAYSIAEYPILRLVTTGEIYTPEVQAEYDSTWKEWQYGRLSLYETELSKGTPAAEILKKLWQYNDTMPADFLKRAGW